MIELLQRRLDGYGVTTQEEQENALKEIVQEVILFALADAGFFEVAAFQGGTSLRILHGLPRFSEDIDFILQQPDPTFSWMPYWQRVVETCNEFGIEPEALGREQMDKPVRTALIKDTSIVSQLNLTFMNHQPKKKLIIKLEIDTNPPAGSGFEYSYLDFPVDYEVCHQDVASNFALKTHALLCRGYLKGRDWYDFNWYIAQGVTPNMILLKNALIQYGPWKGEALNIDREWLMNALSEQIKAIDWKKAAEDVRHFLKPIEQKSLRLWSERFYMSKLQKLDGLMK